MGCFLCWCPPPLPRIPRDALTHLNGSGLTRVYNPWVQGGLTVGTGPGDAETPRGSPVEFPNNRWGKMMSWQFWGQLGGFRNSFWSWRRDWRNAKTEQASQMLEVPLTEWGSFRQREVLVQYVGILKPHGYHGALDIRWRWTCTAQDGHILACSEILE